MAKELPYFKFISAEWLTGNICYESLEAQGLFINICALYWQRGGNLKIDEVKSRFKKKSLIDRLTDRFFSVNDGFIDISFLHEQLTERQLLSYTNSENGKKGGRPIKNRTVNNSKPNDKANESNIEEEKKRIRKEEEKDKELSFPFNSESFLNAWNVLLSQKKWRNKGPSALQMSLKKLKNYPENVAIKMIEDCIAGEWQGLVEPKNYERTAKTISISSKSREFGEL